MLHDQKVKTKSWISWEQKDFLRWNNKHFPSWLSVAKNYLRPENAPLNRAIKDYENIVLVGDLNINVLCPEKDISNDSKDFSYLLSLTNLISTATCTKEPSGTALDVILT